MEDKLLTIQEAADILRFDVMTLYRWKKKGIISFVQFGNDYRIWKSEIDRIIAENTRKATAG